MSSCINQDLFRTNSIPHFQQFHAIHQCGFLFLIHHLLLTSPPCSSNKIPRKLKIAHNLLQNFEKIRIAVNPPDKEMELQFINQMVEEAQHINRYPHEESPIQREARDLLLSLQSLQQSPSPTSFKEFEVCWREFTLSYLKNKLQSLLT